MKTVELYLKVRRACHRDGMSERQAARHFGCNRRTIAKILEHSEPPGYRRATPPKKPKLDPFTGIIDQILKDDKDRPRKQRHTAKRTFERLRDGEARSATGPSDQAERVHRRIHYRQGLHPQVQTVGQRGFRAACA